MDDGAPKERLTLTNFRVYQRNKKKKGRTRFLQAGDLLILVLQVCLQRRLHLPAYAEIFRELSSGDAAQQLVTCVADSLGLVVARNLQARSTCRLQESGTFYQAVLPGVPFMGVHVLRWKRLILLHEKRSGELQK